MIVRTIFIITILGFTVTTYAQQFFSDIVLSESDKKFGAGTTTIPVNYWRFDTCLYSNGICRYNTSTAVREKIIRNDSSIECRLAFSSQKRYQNELADNVFQYFFPTYNQGKFMLVRKLILERLKGDAWVTNMKIDTFFLSLTDTLVFNNRYLIKKVFGGNKIQTQRSLKIFILNSVDESGSIMLHFWVERMGVIKMTDEKCWRYSFEMNDTRTKQIEKLFNRLYTLIKRKYKDPYWTGNPCSFE